jgi:aspartate racemase
MKTVGIIGGIGPESTIEYYRYIIAAYRERHPDGSYPSLVINSIDLNRLLRMVTTDRRREAVDFLVTEIEKLARAGVDFGALASNTPHMVFDEIQARSRLPLVSIVEATCERARELGLRRVALFGTRFTMQGQFYPEVFTRAGISLILPAEDEQIYIHNKYMNEFLNNIFLPETRARLLGIVDRMRERDNIEGLILGGTELPLILTDQEHNGLPFLNTIRIHVDCIVTELLAGISQLLVVRPLTKTKKDRHARTTRFLVSVKNR